MHSLKVGDKVRKEQWDSYIMYPVVYVSGNRIVVEDQSGWCVDYYTDNDAEWIIERAAPAREDHFIVAKVSGKKFYGQGLGSYQTLNDATAQA